MADMMQVAWHCKCHVLTQCSMLNHIIIAPSSALVAVCMASIGMCGMDIKQGDEGYMQVVAHHAFAGLVGLQERDVCIAGTAVLVDICLC
jgi:hypothetical protein